MESLRKSSYSCRDPQGHVLGPTTGLPDDIIYNIFIYADDATLYLKCNQGFDLWQQPELATELESDPGDTHGRTGNGLLTSMLGKSSQFYLIIQITLITSI